MVSQRLFATFYSFLVCLHICCGYQYLQERIPNGEMVPHPCKANNVWKGVGHFNRLGGGDRNPFGLDFKKNDLVWNATICNMDSDNDGKTNGQELGDPDCTWTLGQGPPDITVGLSHPGICEPVDSELCVPRPDWLNCEEEEFVCPAIDEPETFNFTVRIPETPVPSDVTTYTCMFFELPSDQEYHLVAYTPHIDNAAVMHHIVVYGCTEDISRDVTLNSPATCGMGSGHSACSEIIRAWSVGVAGSCEHPHTGFLIGGARGYKYASFQIHWNNPEERSDYTDSSGINFYLTPKLRMYNAGVLVIGQSKLVIPPDENSVAIEGRCSEKCTNRFITGPINVTATFNHMHYLGKSQYTEVRRKGYEVTSLAYDDVYNYDSPVVRLYRDGITVRPGDELRTTCVFKSTSRDTTTYFGDETSDEMCLSFLTYYPKENVKTGTCTSWASLDFCEVINGHAQNCNFSRLADFTDEYIANHYTYIDQKCSITHCRKECKEYIKVLKSTDPCYQGDVYKFRKEGPFRRGGEKNMPIEELQFYSKVDSCDTEIALETCGEKENGNENVTGAAVFSMASAILTVTVVFLLNFVAL